MKKLGQIVIICMGIPLIIIGGCSLLAAGLSNPKLLKAPSQNLHQ